MRNRIGTARLLLPKMGNRLPDQKGRSAGSPAFIFEDYSSRLNKNPCPSGFRARFFVRDVDAAIGRSGWGTARMIVEDFRP
jgi:hypothetical protein